MKFNVPLNNFTAGEWSPKMAARTDTEQYARSCREVTNMLIQMQGGAQYRGGTTRYPIVLGQAALDSLLIGDDPTEQFKIIPYRNTSPAVNKILRIATGESFCQLDGSTIVYGTNTSTTGWTPQATHYQQIGDLLFITNTSGIYKPKVFYYLSGTGYVLRDIDRDHVTSKPWQTIPWGDVNALDTTSTMTVGYVTNAVGSLVTLTSSGGAGGFCFTATAGQRSLTVGSYVRVCNGTNAAGVMRITVLSTSTTAEAVIVQELPQATGFVYGSKANSQSFFQVSAWSDFFGWPKTVTAYQGRIIFGGSSSKPDTIWGSRIGNIFDYEEIPEPNTTGLYGYLNSAFAADNSRAFTLTPNFPNSGAIKSMSSSKTLNIHTDLAEIVAYGTNGALGPVNVMFESSSAFGATSVQPERVNNYSTFIQAGGYKVRDLTYNFSEDQYKAQDLSFVADHLFDGEQVQEICRYEGKSSILLVKTHSGKLFYVTLDREYQINAWGRIVFGDGTEREYPYEDAPMVLSMCAQVHSGGTLIYLLMRRAEQVVAETMVAPWELSNPFTEGDVEPTDDFPIYLDCTHFAVAVGPVDGLTKIWSAQDINGDRPPTLTFDVVADGIYMGEYTITEIDAEFELPHAARSVIIGYKYTGILIPALVEQGGQYGQPVGRVKRLDEVVVRFYRSSGCLYGTRMDNLEEIPFRSPSDPMGVAPEYFTGDKVITLPGDYTRQAQVVIKQDKPYPMYVVCLALRGSSND